MWRFIASLALLLTVLNGRAQHESALKTRILHFPLPDSLLLDSFTVNPESIQLLLPNQTKLDTSYYTFDINSGWLRFKKSLLADSGTVSIQYEAMSVQLTKVYRHKDTTLLFPELKQFYDPFAASNAAGSSDWLETGGLVKSGSITRGFSVGNRQDFALNSSLNLILSGKLNNDLEIQAAISDANVPIQPEGNTQQIQEFDKVFIRLQKDKTIFTAGDIETHSFAGDYFLRYNRKAQGALFETTFAPGLLKNDQMTFSVSGSFGKGRYTRQELTAIESNLGPYKLKGSNHETFIIVLAGSERIYIDGNLLTRGEENDYVINYNTAEVTFTTRVSITSRSRIVAEFEYSDKNYARALITSGADYKAGKFTAGYSYFSESDLKNQTVQQELSDEQKLILSLAGDDPMQAYASGIDSLGFTTERVMYAMRDSLGFDSVFVYSTHPDSALYALSFSYVGAQNGNYVQTGSNANGRVFRWVAPLAGIPQGDYQPVILLISPKKKNLYSFRSAWQFNPNTLIKAEYAISSDDKNLFSTLDDDDNDGRACMVDFSHRRKVGRDSIRQWTLSANLHADVTDRYFSGVDRFRSVEFDRDWNTALMNTGGNRWHGQATVLIQNKQQDRVGISSGFYIRDAKNAAWQQSFSARRHWKKLHIESQNSWLNSPLSQMETQFIKHDNKAERLFGKFYSGVRVNGESNITRFQDSTAFRSGSADWWATRMYAGLRDSSSVSSLIYFQQRTDRVADSLHLQKQSISKDLGLELSIAPASVHSLMVRATYRSVDDRSATLNDQQFLLGSADYNGRIKKRLLVYNIGYEAGSGMEARKEFSYLEVTPGQGVYAWNDYNGNNIKELNEFEPAAFSDQGNYIRVYTQTSDYIRVFTSRVTGNMLFSPADAFSSKKGVLGALSRFNNRSAFSWDKKTSSSKMEEMYLPFMEDGVDSTLVARNALIRNVLTFKTKAPGTVITWTMSESRNRGLLTNGIEDRLNKSHEIKFSQTFFRKWILESVVMTSRKDFSSEYFSSGNYQIEEMQYKPSLAWQPGTSFRWSWLIQYSEKNNTIGTQQAIIRKAGTELKFSKAAKGLALLQFNLLQISFNGSTDSNLGYIMLEGLKPGRNFTWNLSIQRTLGSNMQLNFMYEGRSSEGNPVIHTGNVQVRVFF